jgi:hypothetical protein
MAAAFFFFQSAICNLQSAVVMPNPNFIRETLSGLKAQGLYRRLVEIGSAANNPFWA